MITKFDSILLVDDDEINNILTKSVIEEMNISDEVLTFSDGEQALTHLITMSGEKTDARMLIILDLNMPVMDGEEFLQAFNKLPFLNKERIKITLLSALLPSKKYDYLKTLGVENFIEKPLTDQKIDQLLNELGKHTA